MDTNIVLMDNDEHLENNERNDLCSNSAKTKSVESKPSLENSWNVPADRSERENAVDYSNLCSKL